MKILIVKLGSIGDIVHTLPALAALRRRFPEASIDWLVETRCRDILLDNPCLNDLLEVDTLTWRRRLHLGTTWAEIRHSLRTLRSRRYDVVFDFQGLLKSGLFTWLAHSSRRVGFGRPHLRESLSGIFTDEGLSPPEDCAHVIDRNLHLLKAVGIESAERSFPIALPEEMDLRAARALRSLSLEDYIAMSPGGAWATKRWSPERYGHLAERLAGEWRVASLVLWGPGEEILARRVVQASGGAARLAPATGLREMLPYLKRAKLFVGGDTGPLHIACALGVPVVGLFGPTSPTSHGPFGEGDQAVWKAVPCSPCHKRRCPGFDMVCLRSMAVTEVVGAVGHRLNGSPLFRSSLEGEGN
ncbi:MAG: lipopolysaccharide heptosyltransferase I [Candidatus Tectimicrobiota bacterium]